MKQSNIKKGLLTPRTAKPKQYRFIAFDVETYGKHNEFYMGGVYNERGYKSFYDKKEMMRYLIECDGRETIRVATNLGFDFTVLYFDEPILQAFEYIMKGSGMTQAKTVFDDADESMKYWDTMNYVPFGVEAMGAILGIPKLKRPQALGRIPLNDAEKQELEDYNKRDCEVSYHFMELVQSVVNKEGGELKVTIASTAMDMYCRKYLPYKLRQEYSDDETARKEFLESAFSAYFGGRTEAFIRGLLRNVNVYDINSLYPSVMQNEYPCPNTVFFVRKGSLSNILSYEGISHVRVFCPKNMHKPFLAYRTKDKLLFPTGEMNGWYSHVELRYAIEIGYKVLFVGAQYCYRRTRAFFKDYVKEFYGKRMQNKKTPMELVYKLFLNSLYGKFGERRHQKTHFYYADDEEFMRKYFNNEFRGEITIGDVYAYETYIDETEPERNFVFPIFALYTTAYARIKLYELFSNKEIYYCDTDSVFVSGKDVMMTGSELGALKLEYSCSYGVIVRPKLYFLHTDMIDSETQKNNDVVRMKGVNRANRTDFFHVIGGGEVIKDKFITAKEGARRGIPVNTVHPIPKRVSLLDDKRVWEHPLFDYAKVTRSKPRVVFDEPFSELSEWVCEKYEEGGFIPENVRSL